MGRGDVVKRVSCALVIASVSGCLQSREPAPIVAGTFRFELEDTGSWGGGPLVQLEADGSISGAREQGSWQCAGRATDAEVGAIADALTRLDFLSRAGTRISSGCIDSPIYELNLVMVSGSDAGRASHVRFEWCGALSEYTALVDVVVAPLARLDSEGPCDLCPRRGSRRICYMATEGDPRVCDGAAWRACDATNADDVLLCSGTVASSLECDPALGWVTPIRWTAVGARLVRMPASSDPNVVIALELDVDNRGGSTELPDPMPYAQILDAAGADAWRTSMTTSYFGIPSVRPSTRETIEVLIAQKRAPDDPLVTEPALTFALRERPYPGAPLGAPIPFTIETAP